MSSAIIIEIICIAQGASYCVSNEIKLCNIHFQFTVQLMVTINFFQITWN